MWQLRDRIREGLPELAAGHDSGSALESLGDFDEVFVRLPALQPARSLSLERPGPLLPQPLFHLVDAANEQQDPGGDARMIFPCFFEFTADVRKAGHGGDAQVGVTVDKSAVGTKSIALEVAVEGLPALFVDEDTVETGVGSAFVPVE